MSPSGLSDPCEERAHTHAHTPRERETDRQLNINLLRSELQVEKHELYSAVRSDWSMHAGAFNKEHRGMKQHGVSLYYLVTAPENILSIMRLETAGGETKKRERNSGMKNPQP